MRYPEKDAILILLGATFARTIYDMEFDLIEYCGAYDLDRTQFYGLEDRLAGASYWDEAPLLQSQGKQFYPTRYWLTAKGAEFLLQNADDACRALSQINDMIGVMALGARLRTAAGRAPEEELKTPQGLVQKDAFIETFSNEQTRGVFANLLRRAHTELDARKASNTEVAQAKAYIEAALLLTECPDPQPDLVWEICQRASNMAGIGSLILAILAFVLVG